MKNYPIITGDSITKIEIFFLFKIQTYCGANIQVPSIVNPSCKGFLPKGSQTKVIYSTTVLCFIALRFHIFAKPYYRTLDEVTWHVCFCCFCDRRSIDTLKQILKCFMYLFSNIRNSGEKIYFAYKRTVILYWPFQKISLPWTLTYFRVKTIRKVFYRMVLFCSIVIVYYFKL